MDHFVSPSSVTYSRWTNPGRRGEVDLTGHSDESQSTDTEICTINSERITQSAPGHDATDTEETFTVEAALDAIGFGIFQWKMSLITGLSWIADAMEMMILSILGPELHCEWRLPSYQTALITSVVFVGMGLSSSAWGNLSDKYGRKTGLLICMSWTLYYGLLSAFTPVYGWLLVLRGLVGFGIGGAPQAVTLYSEFLPAKARGTCIMLIASFWAIGAVFEVLLALWIMPTLGWRWLLGLSTIPMVLFLCFCFWLPESPRFDVLTGKRDKAEATLRSIAKQNGTVMPRGTLIVYKQKNRGRIRDLFTPQYCRTTLLLWFIWFANAFCYYGVILLTTEMFQAGDSCGATQGAKIEPSCSLQCKYLTSADYKDLLWTTLAEFPGLLVIIFAIEYLGRKKSMALCFLMFSLFLLPLYACIGRTALTISIFIARAFIAGGYQVVFVYTPEVFPTENRALAMGVASTMARVGALITPFIAQVMLRSSVNLTLALYCGCSVLAGVASLLLPIETLGRGLQESSVNQEARGQATAVTTEGSQSSKTV
ncbi:synaptic vesicle 2-related protein [Solea solea]|uniref:synaptic vesicle 2-related protein n=1 Tax=Solea solea TaxID=90069 RepID=UPI00272C10B4|nr:synaptic vesicle 2-related protein [Solea solea]